jgi:hypothetical protein
LQTSLHRVNERPPPACLRRSRFQQLSPADRPVESTALGDQIQPLDSLKESVRLASGLAPDEHPGRGRPETGREVEALSRFAERIRSFSPDAVRAVATNTLRVAATPNMRAPPSKPPWISHRGDLRP